MVLALDRFRHRLSKTGVRVPVMWARHRGFTTADVFVASYPRSGVTWLRFLLHEVLTGEPSHFENVNERIPYVGHHHHAPLLLPGEGRLIQTHEAYRKEYTRALYLARDARDVVMSEYEFQKARRWVSGDFNEYLLAFFRGDVNGFGSWRYHVRTWLSAAEANKENFRVFHYEALRKDPAKILRQITEFLEVRVDSKRIVDAVANNSFQQMRKKEETSPQKVSARSRFVRSGTAGAWRETFTNHQLQLVQRFLGEELKWLGYQT